MDRIIKMADLNRFKVDLARTGDIRSLLLLVYKKVPFKYSTYN